jgi:E3 ubiquitin-protein ligase ZSWIM2
LVEREIGEVVRGLFTNTGDNKRTTGKTDGESDSREKLSKKEITEDDVCPICQDDLLGQTQPTTYCK